MTGPPPISTAGLTKRYGSTLALDRLDLEIRPGEVFGFLGPNGAGKTTTIRLLLGLIHPTSGTARVLGGDAWTDVVEIHRGFLQEGMFADVVVFDPATIADHATFENPHQYATGMKHVFVNGQQVLKDGEHTGSKPGRALRGPSKKL